jgi:hypothetical protein
MSRPQHVPIDSGAIHIGNATIHHSHKIKIHRGLRYCGKCGYVATGQIRNLKRQCQPSSRNGKALSSASMTIGFPLLYLAVLNGQMGPLLDDYYPLLPTQEVVLGCEIHSYQQRCTYRKMVWD